MTEKEDRQYVYQDIARLLRQYKEYRVQLSDVLYRKFGLKS